MSLRATLRSPAFLLGFLGFLASSPLAAQQLGPTGSGVNHALGVRAGFGARVGLASTRGGRLLAAVDAGTARGVLVLDPIDLRGEGYHLVAEQADGAYVDVPSGPVRTFRGELLGAPASSVAVSLLPDGLRARVALATGQEFWVEPLPAGSASGSATHAVYRGQDVLDPGGACALEALADAGLHVMQHGSIGGGFGGSGGSGGSGGAGSGTTSTAGSLKVADLACDADFEFFGHYGTVAAVESRIQTVINAMNVQYEMEVGITHLITTIIVRTSANQPYTATDPNTLLDQFRVQWTTNHGNVTRDIAHLFTGKELDGSVIGIAWLGVVCNSSYGYGLVQSDFSSNFAYSTDLSAHELGHNWNANHCTCPSYTMNPYITGANHFDPAASIPPIVAFRDASGCLADAGGGGGPPPVDPNTGLASADYATPSGTITAGTYVSTQVNDEIYESLTEVQSGGKPNTRYSLLEHVWTLAVPAGHNYTMRVQAHHSANSENDDFQFLYSPDNSVYAPMLTVTKTADDNVAQTFVFPEDIAGTLYVKVRDTDHTVGKKALDAVHVDRLAVAVDTTGADVTPPGKLKGLSALAGNGQVSLDWTDSNAQDLAGYVVSRSTVSGGPYSALGVPVATSAYVDNAVSNGTTYYYVVSARDTAGNTGAASAQVSAMPIDPAAPATTMHVQKLVVTTVSVSAGWKQGRADVTVVDEHGNPVAGALVTGAFSGGLNQSASATTGANGVAVLTTFQTAKGTFTLSFCVTGMTKAGLTYVPAQDVQSCGSK